MDTFPVTPEARLNIKYFLFLIEDRDCWTLERFANCKKESVMDSSHGTRPRRSQSVRRRTIDDTLPGQLDLILYR